MKKNSSAFDEFLRGNSVEGEMSGVDLRPLQLHTNLSLCLLGRDEVLYTAEGDLIRSDCNVKNCPDKTVQ